MTNEAHQDPKRSLDSTRAEITYPDGYRLYIFHWHAKTDTTWQSIAIRALTQGEARAAHKAKYPGYYGALDLIAIRDGDYQRKIHIDLKDPKT